jgi:hypothetical protein
VVVYNSATMLLLGMLLKSYEKALLCKVLGTVAVMFAVPWQAVPKKSLLRLIAPMCVRLQLKLNSRF